MQPFFNSHKKLTKDFNPQQVNSMFLDCDQIDEQLYLGSFLPSQKKEFLDSKNITHIVQVQQEVEQDGDTQLQSAGKFADQGVLYHIVSIDDVDEANILSVLPDSLEFIKGAIDGGKTVLVHCMAGMSRSASIVIAYLMQKNSWNYTQAFQYVAQKRPRISPNAGFQKQLQSLEN